MKKIAFVILCLSVAILSSCGSSEQDANKIKREQDSMSKIDGNVAIDRANQILLGDSSRTSSDSANKTKPTSQK